MAPPEMHAALQAHREMKWHHVKIAPDFAVLDGEFSAESLRFMARLMDGLRAAEQAKLNARLLKASQPGGEYRAPAEAPLPLPQESPCLG